MVGPMKKKVISSVFITAIVLILIFGLIAFFYVKQTNKKIAELEIKSEVVQRFVFLNDMTAGEVVTATDVLLVDVKGESAPTDSYKTFDDMIGKRLKVNANAKTIVTKSLFFADDEAPTTDLRLQEFNMITLPSDLDVGDYIDVRLRFPTGEDYSVLVGKKVESFGATGTTSNTIFLRLDEEEIVKMSSAIIESYIRDGILLYANRYIDPDNQLHDYSRVDYVAKFEEAMYIEITDEMSDNITIDDKGNTVYLPSGDPNAEPKLVVDGKIERTLSEIASIIGLTVEETENIQIALADNNQETLNYYKNKLHVADKGITANYPVKREVARLIANNPNILAEVKAKYNVEKLEQERVEFLDTNITTVDPITGEITIADKYLQSINENMEQEITLQKTERQEYLLNLLSKQ